MRLNFIPDEDSYRVTPSVDVVERTAVHAGLPAMRLDLFGETLMFSVRYTLNKDAFERFMEFLDEYDASPQWFDALLISNPITAEHHLRNHKVQIVPNSVSISEFNGHRFAVEMQLEGYLDELLPLSRIYPVTFGDSIITDSQFDGAFDYVGVFSDSLETGVPVWLSGSLDDILLEYAGPPEGIDSDLPTWLSGELDTILVSYTIPSEAIDSDLPTWSSGTLEVILVTYGQWPAEGLDSNLTWQSGTLV